MNVVGTTFRQADLPEYLLARAFLGPATPARLGKACERHCRAWALLHVFRPWHRGGPHPPCLMTSERTRVPSLFIHVNGLTTSTGFVEIFSPRMFSNTLP